MPGHKRGRTMSRGRSMSVSRSRSRSSVIARRPSAPRARKAVRFRQGSSKVYRAGKRAVNSLVKVGVLEKKQSEGTAKNELPLVARCADNLQYLSFIATEASISTENANPLDLFTLAAGTAANAYVGKYINVTSLFMRFCIQIPPIDQGTQSATLDFKGLGPRKLRLLLVAPKMTSAPAGTTLTTEDSLFLDYAGLEYGLEHNTDKPAWEFMSAPINKKNWVVLKDRQVVVQPNRVDTFGSPLSVPANSNPQFYYQNAQAHNVASWNESHFMKSGGAAQFNVDCSIPINKKVLMNSTTHRPEDLNAAYRFIVISEMPGMKQSDQKITNAAPYGSNHVLVSSRSFLQYIDA